MASSFLLPAISAGPSRAAGSRAAGASAAAQKLFSVGAVKPAPCGSWRSAAGGLHTVLPQCVLLGAQIAVRGSQKFRGSANRMPASIVRDSVCGGDGSGGSPCTPLPATLQARGCPPGPIAWQLRRRRRRMLWQRGQRELPGTPTDCCRRRPVRATLPAAPDRRQKRWACSCSSRAPRGPSRQSTWLLAACPQQTARSMTGPPSRQAAAASAAGMLHTCMLQYRHSSIADSLCQCACPGVPANPTVRFLHLCVPFTPCYALQSQLAERFLPVDLDTPGLRILHFDPPIFALPNFFTGGWMAPGG
jgi:hypothetical protein